MQFFTNKLTNESFFAPCWSQKTCGLLASWSGSIPQRQVRRRGHIPSFSPSSKSQVCGRDHRARQSQHLLHSSVSCTRLNSQKSIAACMSSAKGCAFGIRNRRSCIQRRSWSNLYLVEHGIPETGFGDVLTNKKMTPDGHLEVQIWIDMVDMCKCWVSLVQYFMFVGFNCPPLLVKSCLHFTNNSFNPHFLIVKSPNHSLIIPNLYRSSPHVNLCEKVVVCCGFIMFHSLSLKPEWHSHFWNFNRNSCWTHDYTPQYSWHFRTTLCGFHSWNP